MPKTSLITDSIKPWSQNRTPPPTPSMPFMVRAWSFTKDIRTISAEVVFVFFCFLSSILNMLLFSLVFSKAITQKIYIKIFLLRPDDGRSISRNVAHLNLLVHDTQKIFEKNCTLLFWQEPVKFWWGSMSLIFDGFRSQNVLILL